MKMVYYAKKAGIMPLRIAARKSLEIAYDIISLG
jgi:hypothetical protein